MRVVLDSNIIIAAFASRGLCSSLFELCIEKHEVIISQQILQEVSKNLEKKFKMPEKSINEVVAYLVEFCTLLNCEMLAENVCRDRDDDGIIGLAFQNAVKYIITGDKDLLVLEKNKIVRIITPREFWALSKKSGNI
ncbi:MAG TPA: putative toxin-antitoxin system toxin component, PIN family [Spirochaetota bacterium]|nr:putative toxin-antitoxin system toxin component, PIN family [Spirochaetota bacterium]